MKRARKTEGRLALMMESPKQPLLVCRWEPEKGFHFLLPMVRLMDLHLETKTDSPMGLSLETRMDSHWAERKAIHLEWSRAPLREGLMDHEMDSLKEDQKGQLKAKWWAAKMASMLLAKG
jgi:hypothetical protein